MLFAVQSSLANAENKKLSSPGLIERIVRAIWPTLNKAENAV